MHMPPQYDPYTQETTKVAELKDQFGKTRFKIALTDYDDPNYPSNDNLQTFDNYFQVTVVSYCFGESQNTPIYLYDEVFGNIKSAYDKFYEQVEIYRRLIDVETKGWQNIEIYKDKINYRKIDPDCCKNCVWAKLINPKDCPPHELKKHKDRFICTNPEIRKELNDFEPIDPKQYNNTHHKGFSRKHFNFDLAPYTQEDGLCDNYARGLPLQYKLPQQSYQDFIDHSCKDKRNITEQIIKYEVNKQYKSAINTDILPIILPKIKQSIKQEFETGTIVFDGNKLVNDYNNDNIVDERDFINFNGGNA